MGTSILHSNIHPLSMNIEHTLLIEKGSSIMNQSRSWGKNRIDSWWCQPIKFSALATTIYHFGENDNQKFHKYQSSHHTKQQTKRLELCIIMAELGSRIRNHILPPIFVNHNRMSKRFYNKQLKRRSYFFCSTIRTIKQKSGDQMLDCGLCYIGKQYAVLPYNLICICTSVDAN